MSNDRYPMDGIHVEEFDKSGETPIDKMISALLSAKPKGIGYLLILVTPTDDGTQEALFDIASNLTTEQMLIAMKQHGKRLKAVN